MAVTSPTFDPTCPTDAIDGVVELSGTSTVAQLREYQDRAIQGNAIREPVYISCLELDVSYHSVIQSCPPTSTLSCAPLALASLSCENGHGYGHDRGHGGGHARGNAYAYARHRDGLRTRYGCGDGAQLSGRNPNGYDETRTAGRHDYTNSSHSQRQSARIVVGCWHWNVPATKVAVVTSEQIDCDHVRDHGCDRVNVQ